MTRNQESGNGVLSAAIPLPLREGLGDGQAHCVIVREIRPLVRPSPCPSLRGRGVRAVAFLLCVVALAATLFAADEKDKPKESPTPPVKSDKPVREGEVRVGKLSFGGGKTTICFAEGFLAQVEQQTRIKVERRFATVDLASEDVFQFPLLILSSEGAFTLSKQEKDNLKSYLGRGGFVLASAGCSNAAFATSFESLMKELFPKEAMDRLDMKHPVFHTIHDIDALIDKKATPNAALHGLERGGRLVVIYSPLGLNDTAHAGSGCCCCGGNELRNAHLVNANILAYALTR